LAWSYLERILKAEAILRGIARSIVMALKIADESGIFQAWLRI
jgi:hypothetical protein